MRQIAQQAGAAALDNFFHRAAEVDIHLVEAKIFGESGGGSHHVGIGSKNLRRDGMLVFAKVEIVKRARGIARQALRR